MKDLPHHIKKLNRRVIRSAHREEVDLESYETNPPVATQKPGKTQVRKQVKRQMRTEREERTPTHLSPEERNKRMKKRVPVFDRLSAKPKRAKATRKKTPRI